MEEKLEKLVQEIMAECEKDGEPVTEEEAKVMAEMELNSKSNRRYEQTAEKKERKPREIKLDDEKVNIINGLAELLNEYLLGGVECTDVTIANPQKEITFSVGEGQYSISLIKHRKK